MPGRAALLGAVALTALALAGATATRRPAQTLPAEPSATELEFLRRHWVRPIPAQGAAPPHFDALERSLRPADCGACHPLQLADWRGSLHAASMGPGVSGQLEEMARQRPGGGRACLACHAPLAEQDAVRRGPGGAEPNPDFDPVLRTAGVACAACHRREHRTFGPPRRPGVPTPGPGRTSHDGAVRSTAYLRAEFCAACHQFPPDGMALNGKLLENTYEEWRASPAARRGLQCQDCHMPDRRHLWRGIHDPEMVRSGVTISAAIEPPAPGAGRPLRATLTIATTGVGHHFPTYVTPRVVIRAELLDGGGRTLPGSVEERAIGREVTLDLAREIADTRIPAGGKTTFRYVRTPPGAAARLRLTVTVFPDHFYTGFFETLLAQGAGVGEARIREALEATRRSPFEIYRREVPLG